MDKYVKSETSSNAELNMNKCGSLNNRHTTTPFQIPKDGHLSQKENSFL